MNELPDLDNIAADMACRQDDLLADLESIVRCESPSNDLAAVRRCADLIASLAERRGCGPAAVQHTAGPPVVRIGSQSAPVLILGHLDTVHPLGALARNPWRIQDNRAHGPGAFDMKSGIVMGLHAMAARCATGLSSFLITSDEELGSPSSRALIEEAAAVATAVLVAEPSQRGALKTARKGVSNYVLRFRGRAAHAGLEPQLGANACVALAEIALTAGDLGDNARGTTVTPTVASAGTAANAVPDTAQLHIDARAITAAEQMRVDAQLRRLTTSVTGVSIEVTGGPNRPPLEESASAKLFGLARAVAHRIGVPQPTSTAVGGGSDGNFTAALGIPTLDGLGAVGAGAHTSEEWVEIASLPERTALLAAMISQLGAIDLPRGGPNRSAHIAGGPRR